MVQVHSNTVLRSCIYINYYYKLNYSGNSLQPFSRNTNTWEDSTHTQMEFKQTGCGWYGNELTSYVILASQESII
jgi:hypothetical protein